MVSSDGEPSSIQAMLVILGEVYQSLQLTASDTIVPLPLYETSACQLLCYGQLLAQGHLDLKNVQRQCHRH